MFLNSIIKRNKELINFGKKSFQKGLILPNSYVLNLDTIKENAKLIKSEAEKYNIDVYQMTKQFGRNPLIAQAIKNVGITKSVCVDFQEAMILNEAGIELGNIGHLVQIPRNLIRKILKLKPEVVTVFSLEKIEQISKEAQKLKMSQDIILRVYASNDIFYDGQQGGFHIDKLDIILEKIKKMPNVNLVGFTSFPTFLYDGKKTAPTENINTINSAVNIAKKHNIKIKHINTPSANSVSTMKSLHEFNSTHAEPGHAFIGTMHSNAFMDEPETPAIIYMSEISHTFDNKAFFYGGGYYPRGHLERVLVCSEDDEQIFNVNPFTPGSIDYYLNFDIKDKNVNVGDIVISSFRTQIFVTRALVVVVEGLSKNKPKILGTYSSQGEKIKWI